MSESSHYNNVAPLRNVAALVELIARVSGRSHGLPGMACFYGPSGYGKTTAAVYSANKFNAFNVQVKSVWTGKKLCQAILEDLGIPPSRTIADMVDQVSDELGKTGRPLLIDEADHLVNRGMIEIVRDIYESSGAPVILIGEEQLPKKLMQWERVHGRMLDWVGAEPGVVQDVTHLAPIYCPGVELDDAFKQHLLEASNSSIRRICINLARVLEVVRTDGPSDPDGGAPKVTRQSWGQRGFFTGAAPTPRRL